MKEKRKIFVHGKKSDGFVLLKTLLYISALLIIAGGFLVSYMNLMKQNKKNYEKAVMLIDEMNMQVENEINGNSDFYFNF